MKTEILTVQKHVVTMTIDEMWRNYTDCLGGMGREFPLDGLMLTTKQVYVALFDRDVDHSTRILRIRNMFRDGDTYFLMGKGMEFLDGAEFAEIEVVDDDVVFRVGHEDICI